MKKSYLIHSTISSIYFPYHQPKSLILFFGISDKRPNAPAASPDFQVRSTDDFSHC